MTTITSFATAVDVTISELKLEAFLPADQATATALSRRAERPGRRALAWPHVRVRRVSVRDRSKRPAELLRFSPLCHSLLTSFS
jgi:hypothetical protein